jgi:acyl-coenzyme A thioesterase PaaI-like protein
VSEVHAEVNEALRAAWGIEPDAAFPPASHQRLNLAWNAYEPKRTLLATVRFPADAAGAQATIDHGQALAAFETAAHAFACLTAHKRCVTLTMEGQFLRQLTADGEPVSVEIQIRATRKSIVFVEGVVKGADRHPALFASASFAALKQHASGVEG